MSGLRRGPKGLGAPPRGWHRPRRGSFPGGATAGGRRGLPRGHAPSPAPGLKRGAAALDGAAMDFPTLAEEAGAAPIDDCALRLADLAAALPEVALLPGEEQALGGHLFPGATTLVGAVGAALAARPDLFPHAPFSGPALLQAQERASAWLILRDQLQLFAAQAQAAYLKEQGEAARGALHILEQVRHEEALPSGLGAPDRRWRASLLTPAYRALGERSAARQRPRRAEAIAAASPGRGGSTPRERQLARAQIARHLREAAAQELAPAPPGREARARRRCAAAPGAPGRK